MLLRNIDKEASQLQAVCNSEHSDFVAVAPKVEGEEGRATDEDEVDELLQGDSDELMLPSQDAKEIAEHPSPALMESLVAKELAELSMKDREQVYYDIHGVSDIIDEQAEPDFLDKKLKEMQQELDSFDEKYKKAYLIAYSSNPQYVLGRDLRLRFLRADRFDPKMAAQRYINHFQWKLELFGDELLGRDVIQDDLDGESLDALYGPFNQLLPQRDAAGRAVFLYAATGGNQRYSQQAICRRGFYNAMMVSDDVETQRKGLAFIVYALGSTSGGGGSDFATRVWKSGQMFRCLPIRVVCLHFCYSNLTWVPVMSTIRLAADLCLRMRFRPHRGSHSECMYNLQTFGIPTNAIPIDERGEFVSDLNRKFLTNRRIQERKWKENQTPEVDTTTSSPSLSPSDRITLPSSSDVLLGRGKGYFTHVGNIRYRNLIEDLKEQYDKSRSKVKKQMTVQVVDMIKKSGGRFLRSDGSSGCWVLVDDQVARYKVSHSFRAQRPTSSSQETKNTSKIKSTRSSTGRGNSERDSAESPRSKRSRAV